MQLEEFCQPRRDLCRRLRLPFLLIPTAGCGIAQRHTSLMVERFGLYWKNLVVEIASNDGYLLQYFVEKHIPVLGVEPAGNWAARERAYARKSNFRQSVLPPGLPPATWKLKPAFGEQRPYHVPDINDFVWRA